MPTYPVAAPVLADPILTINRFLQQPAWVARRIRTITDEQFIAEKLLSAQKVKAQGGAVMYGVSESIYSDRNPALVNPGAEYPRALTPDGQAALALTTKYGQDVAITDEKIAREQFRTLDQSLNKAANSVVAFVDTTVLAVIASAVTQTQAAAAAWTSTSATPLLDVNLAIAQVADLGQEYNPNVLVTTYANAARLASMQNILQGLPRESANSLTTTGYPGLPMIAGLTPWIVPARRMPSGVGAFIADSNSLGFMTYEDLGSPEYVGSPDGVQTWTRRNPVGNDEYLLRVRRIFAPAVSDPNACVKITGV